MYFSESMGVDYQEDYEWFDPVLDTDTPLFVDPFLIFKEVGEEWGDAHDELIAYFQDAFEMLAPNYTSPGSQRYKRTVTMMTFPEPKEFGLGFVSEGQNGAGSGDGFARKIVEAMAEAIERGLGELQHFEELGLLVPGIARDRISDITCNILKPRFIAYTQKVCQEFLIPMKDVEVPSAELDPIRRRRITAVHKLPINAETGRPLLLTPKRFLRELPTLNSRDWWDFAEPELRADLNLDISMSVDKEEIIRLARSHADTVRRWSEEREGLDARPYPVDRDPAGVHNWVREGRAIAFAQPLSLETPEDGASLDQFIESIVRNFRRFVELQGGWRLLWNDKSPLTPKREDSIQLLFKGVVQAYCAANHVTLDREVELGRGPVDFVLSKSSTDRVLLEIKKVSSSKFVDGIEKQLISYMESDGCMRGWYLAVQFYDSKSEVTKAKALPAITKNAAKTTGFQLSSTVIDATRKLSASNI